MGKRSKQLSNPFSMGGGGLRFEVHVQACFVALMLVGGYAAPCQPLGGPIKKIKLQGKFAGYDTDDLILFLEGPREIQKRKALIQIRHSIKITTSSKLFDKTIQAAWDDFNNPNLFTKTKDVIVLITGPLTVSDTQDVRTILEWARHSEDANEFITKVNLAKFSSQIKQNKLKAFRTSLKKANDGRSISDETLYDFLRHFYLLGYDLDIKAGGVLSMIHSLIALYSPENHISLWSRLVEEVQSVNQNAGTITLDSLPEDLRFAFKQRSYSSVPAEFTSTTLPSSDLEWNDHPYALDLAKANLLGSWNEQIENDLKIVRQFIGENYDTWITRMREILQKRDSPLTLKNGRWRISNRKALWKSLGAKIFDEDLNKFKQCSMAVLTEVHPQFELSVENRYPAGFYENVLQYSTDIRKGIAESLALLGNQSNELSHCSNNKGITIAVSTVNEIFKKSDWALWGSLNDFLPILAEAAPDEFLNIVERALQSNPCPFDELFSQEGRSILGENYLIGLFWSLEILAWEEKFLSRVTVILGELAAHDPGGNYSNRPFDSLVTIFLPWLPQTTASIAKRKVAIKTLQKELPAIAWKLLAILILNQPQTSMGAHKSKWRDIILANWKKEVTQQDYQEQINFYIELMVAMAMQDIKKLNKLINHLDKLPEPSILKILEHLSSEVITNAPEEERLPIWEELTSLSGKSACFSTDILTKIEAITARFSPKDSLNICRRLFSSQALRDVYEKNESWNLQQEKLDAQRYQAVRDILADSGIESIIEFAKSVELPSNLGNALGMIAIPEIDVVILPNLLEADNKKITEFVSGYIWTRRYQQDWAWVATLDMSKWSVSQIGKYLCCLPFTVETWTLANKLLGEFEGEYWNRTSANPYQANADLNIAIDKLISFERPQAAIRCFYKKIQDKQPFNHSQSVKALLAAVNSSESSPMETYHIVEIIKALQADPATHINNLCAVEWAYLSLLDNHNGVLPKSLENRLASDADFFCEVIRLLYRSKNEDLLPKEPNEQQKALASHAWKLLNEWRLPPGTLPNGFFSGEQFKSWLKRVKEICIESGHLDVALRHIGQVMVYCPRDSEGFWIDKTVADILNEKDAEEMRASFGMSFFNSRGVHWLDPTGNQERELAEKYRQRAEELDNAGYQRLAATLRELEEYYSRNTDRIA